MKRLILASAALLALAAPALAAPAVASAVNAATATGTAAVTVYTPITVSQTQGLDFGTITSGAAGSVAIDPNSGGRSVGGGVGAVAADVGQPGSFEVTGQANAAINVAVSQAITGFAGGITGFAKPGVLPTALNGTSAGFAVGGYLNIPASTKAGAYTGTYTVAVNYP